MRILIILLFLVLGSQAAQAQNKSDLKGIVGNGEESLPGASVVILSVKDSSLVNFSLSDNDGFFLIKSIDPGEYLLQLTYLGYRQYSDTIRMSGVDIDMGEIILETADTRLDAIEIKGEHIPMALNKDTLEYNADAFKTQPNEVVEDLLRRLPGIEVESDGNIKAQGEDVQEVLVDGKKFFGDDPKLATRNLPADAVEKVQVFDKKSDEAEFSGVDDGVRQKTINLDLKDDRKSGVFGSATAGIGNDSRYKASMSLNRFNAKTQLSVIGNVNNVNEQGFSVGDYVNFMSGMGWGRGRSSVPVFNGLSNGFVETRAGGINLNYDLSKKTELSVSYFINDIQNEISSTSVRENYGLDSGNFFTDEATDQLNVNTNHRVNFEIEQEIDSSQDLRIRGSYGLNLGNSMSGTSTQISESRNEGLQNETDAMFDSEGDNSNFSINGTYRKKFGRIEKRTLTLSGSYNNAINETLAELLSENSIYDDNNMLEMFQLLDQRQNSENRQKDYYGRVSFVEPVGNRSFLELEYERRNYNNDVLSEFFDIQNGEEILNFDLSNAYIRDYYYDRYAASIHFNSDKSQLTLEAAVQSSHLRGDIEFQDVTIENDVFRFLPRLSWRYDLANKSNIRVYYNTSINEPSLEQLQPNPDNSNPLNIYIGNPELVPEYRHNLRFNYFSYDQFSFRSFYAFINASYTSNNITNVVQFNEDFVQTTTPVNVDYALSISSSQEYGSPTGFLNLRMNLRNRVGYTRSITFINARESNIERINGNVRLQLENRNKKIWDWNVGGSYSYNINRYEDERTANLSFSSQNVFGDLTYVHKNSFALSTGCDINFYSEENFGEQQVIPIVKASVSKYFLKDQRGELKLSVFDMFNQNLGISRVENQNYIENSEIISLSRYFMMSFTYAFKPMGQKK